MSSRPRSADSRTQGVREGRLRHALDRKGYALRKMPSDSWLRAYYGPGYQVVDISSETVVFGCYKRAYEATLAEVEQWARERAQRKP